MILKKVVPRRAFLLAALALSLSRGSNSVLAQATTPAPPAPAAPTPEMAAVLQQLASYNAPPLPTLLPSNARNTPAAQFAAAELASRRGVPAFEPVGDIFHRVIPGPNGQGQLLVRFYKPRGAVSNALPMTVYFHGGGFVIADLNVYDPSCRALANASGSIVASVAYRLAPENPAPAAHEDAYAATQYLMRTAASYGANPAQVAVAGESAGGNLATAVCLMAKARGGLMPVHQALVYPYILNPNRLSDAALNQQFPSYAIYANAKPLGKGEGKYFWRFYTPANDYSGFPEMFLEPIRATLADLRGLPPATIVGAEIDVLQSEGLRYANNLRAAGVPVQYRLYRGVTHEFFGMAAVVPQARDAETFAGAGLRSTFNAIQ